MVNRIATLWQYIWWNPCVWRGWEHASYSEVEKFAPADLVVVGNEVILRTNSSTSLFRIVSLLDIISLTYRVSTNIATGIITPAIRANTDAFRTARRRRGQRLYVVHGMWRIPTNGCVKVTHPKVTCRAYRTYSFEYGDLWKFVDSKGK